MVSFRNDFIQEDTKIPIIVKCTPNKMRQNKSYFGNTWNKCNSVTVPFEYMFSWYIKRLSMRQRTCDTVYIQHHMNANIYRAFLYSIICMQTCIGPPFTASYVCKHV